MTPGARIQAAIEVMGAVTGGQPAERALTNWARGARYAGSKDRAAVRDHVYDTLRRLRTSAWLGGLGDVGGLDGVHDCRRLFAGMLRGQGAEIGALFTGDGHAPAPIDLPQSPDTPPAAIAADLPDWAFERLRQDYGLQAGAVAEALRHRAPVTIRTNLRKTTPGALRARLAEAGITAEAHPMLSTALQIAGTPRGLTNLEVFRDGYFELQDAGSQALVDRLPRDGTRVLDLCAGGGGKALALAAQGQRDVFAHDTTPERMRDLPARAARAGVSIERLDTPEETAPFDGVIADVPCSGSGAWRRTPEARWRFDEEDLERLLNVQASILDRAVSLVRPGGWVGYMTCSLFDAENAGRVDDRLAKADVALEARWSCTPLDGADGFHLSLLRRL